MIRRFLLPPVFEEEEKNFRARFINGFALSVILLLLLAMTPHLLGEPKNSTLAIFSGLIAIMLLALYLLRRGRVDTSGMLIVVLGWLGVSLQAYTADGVKDVIIVAFIALGLLASIIADRRAGGIVILSGVGVIWALALLEANEILTPSAQEPIAFARDLSFVFIAVTVLIYFSTKSLRDALQRAAASEKDLQLVNDRLHELNESLEDRVARRMAELTEANARNERRARQFEAVAQVARATTSIQDEDALLLRLARVISEQFGFYHVGVFLLDENSQYAVLRASNSDGGRRMLARRHRLKVGQMGIVGHVAASGTPRIASDVTADSAFRNNPDLPETRAEMALPLRAGEQVIGVLDIQSTEPDAFRQEDTEVLYILADQVAIAIQNARSHEATQQLLEEAQKTSVAYLREAWRLLRAERKSVGYLVSGNALRPLTSSGTAPQVNRVNPQGTILPGSAEKTLLTMPIRIHGEVVGALDVHIPAGQDWDADEVDIVKAVADRLSLALESATLLQTAQKRAEIERLTADISGKISASINLRNVVQTAVEALGQALPGAEVIIQLDAGQTREKTSHEKAG